jgi:hypothetical protein
MMPLKTYKSVTASLVGKLVMIVLGAVLAGVGTYLWTDYIKPKPIYINIQVFDDSSPAKPLKNVAVWLGLNDVDSKQTGDFGLVRFEVPHKHRKEQVTPRIQTQGYSQISGNAVDKIILDRGETSVIYILKKDAPPSPEYVRKVYSSGSKPSGPGASFSAWYELCNDPEGEGWEIAEGSFALTGDRQCNAWSECRQSVAGDLKKVCWQFRMQGHSEQTGGLFNQGNTGVQFSTGILNVLWKKGS